MQNLFLILKIKAAFLWKHGTVSIERNNPRFSGFNVNFLFPSSSYCDGLFISPKSFGLLQF